MILKRANINFNTIIALIILLSGGFFNPVFAAVTPTAATGGSSISADTNTTNGTATWTALTGPVITEGTTGSIGVGTIVLDVPTGFTFDTSGTAPTVLVTRTAGSGADTRNINNLASGSTIAITRTATQLTITITDVTSSSVTNSLTWQNIRVRPTAGTPLASENITKSGSSTISGITNGVTNLGTLTEVAGAFSASQSTMSANPASVSTDGGAQTTITVTAKDQFGNPVSGQSVTLSVSGTGNTLTAQPVITNSFGIAASMLSSTKAETKTISTGVVAQTSATFTAGALDHIAVTPSGSQNINGGSTISFSAQGYDLNNNPISGLAFTWAVISGTGTGTISSGGTLTANRAGTLTVTATSDAVTGSSGTITVSNVWPITDSQSVSTDEDTPILINLSATDANGDTLTYSINSNPDSGSLSELNPLTGAVTYNPSTNYNGQDSFTFIANDGAANSGIGTVFITVNLINDPPALNSIGDKNGDEESTITFTIFASDPENNTLTYSASNLPSGASFDVDTQTFSWTPDNSQSGDYSLIHFEATDGFLTDSEDITITVANINRPPTFDTISNQTGNENENLTFTISATDEDGDILTYSTGDLPEGASFDENTQTFSWTPTFDQSGNYLVVFTASDNDLQDNESVPIDVGNVNRSPELSAIDNKTVNENEELTFTISAGDADNDTLTYSASNLPVGATFDADTQTFSWTPDYSQSGIYTDVYFETTDGFATDAENISIVVDNINHAPALDSIGNQSGSENSNLTFTISASDPDNDTLTYSASNLPSGATFDADTQTFSWTPSPIESGTYDNIYFEVSDNSAITSENITITINNVNQAPTLDSIGNKSGAENSALTFTISASDLDGDTLTYSASNLPSGADFSTSTRTLTWTPSHSQSGDYPSVHFEVTDGSASTSEDITIAITNTNRAPSLDAIGNKTIDENQLLTFTISASDLDGDTLTYSASNLPSGAAFNASNGTFTWTPDHSQSGNYPSVHFEATDGASTAGEDISIAVNNVSQDDGGVVYFAPVQIVVPTPVIETPPIALTLSEPENNSAPIAINEPNSAVLTDQNQESIQSLASANQNGDNSEIAAPTAEQNPTATAITQAENLSLLANIATFMKSGDIIETTAKIIFKPFEYLKDFFLNFFF